MYILHGQFIHFKLTEQKKIREKQPLMKTKIKIRDSE